MARRHKAQHAQGATFQETVRRRRRILHLALLLDNWELLDELLEERARDSEQL